MKKAFKMLSGLAIVAIACAVLATPTSAGGSSYSLGFAYGSGGYGYRPYYGGYGYKPNCGGTSYSFAFSYGYRPPVYYVAPPPVVYYYPAPVYYYGGCYYRY